MFILGVFGPWQVIALLIIVVLPIVLVFTLRKSKAKQNANTQSLDSTVVVNNNVSVEESNKPKDALDQLERLNKLRESGALTQEEFDAQKAKLL